MKKISWLVVCLFMVSLGVVSCPAQPTAPDEARFKVSGIVDALDEVNGTLSVDTETGKMIFDVTNDTEILKDGEEVELGDIDQGSEVEVEYYDKGEASLVATLILVEDAPYYP